MKNKIINGVCIVKKLLKKETQFAIVLAVAVFAAATACLFS